MHRLLAAAVTCGGAAALAVGAALGMVAALNATPEQPNVPLVSFPDGTPGLDGTPGPDESPGSARSGQ
jgi:hypothetical protein